MGQASRATPVFDGLRRTHRFLFRRRRCRRHGYAILMSAPAPPAPTIRRHVGVGAEKYGSTKKLLALNRRSAYVAIALFRTCLWPCVGRWASGQEAGQPPKEEILSFLAPATGSRRRNRQTPRSTGDA